MEGCVDIQYNLQYTPLKFHDFDLSPSFINAGAVYYDLYLIFNRTVTL